MSFFSYDHYVFFLFFFSVKSTIPLLLTNWFKHALSQQFFTRICTDTYTAPIHIKFPISPKGPLSLLLQKPCLYAACVAKRAQQQQPSVSVTGSFQPQQCLAMKHFDRAYSQIHNHRLTCVFDNEVCVKCEPSCADSCIS